MLEEDQGEDVKEEQEVTRLTNIKFQSVRLNYYDIFPYQVLDEEGDMIEEAIIGESKENNLNQELKDEN